MEIKKIAQKIHKASAADNIILIYAFNSTGKTRLSVEYKNITKEANNDTHVGVYYNAYSEDLFVWDNNEEDDNKNIKLDILPSYLNRFHSFLIEDEDILNNKLLHYNPKYKYSFNANNDPEKGIDSVSFYRIDDEENEKPIKISRGEERIFVWCFFLALFDIDGWANIQNQHIFIDDPVSSLDDNNIYITVNSLFEMIESNHKSKRIIITTHHIGLFSILADRLTRGGKSGSYKNLTKRYTLINDNGKPKLNSENRDVFMFHLHLMQVLQNAYDSEVLEYHFVLLRQLMEHISSFLGIPSFGYVIQQIESDKTKHEEIAQRINSLSHKDVYKTLYFKAQESDALFFRDIFFKIMDKYKFKY